MQHSAKQPQGPAVRSVSSRAQWGGTVLGFIIGVVVGLGAALAVAVYVTKVPIPFMSGKTQGRNADHDAAESKKNKDWDPNTPLYGKNPARPATPAASGVAGVAGTVTPAPAASAPAGAAAPLDKAAKGPVAVLPQPVKVDGKSDAKPAGTADPLGDLAKARTAVAAPVQAPTPAAAPGAADPFEYFVQAGAFRTPEDAEAQRAKLALMGLEARVTEREQAGRTVFRVRMGPYGKKEDAERTKDRLDVSGNETALVRVQR